jgi:hypothetical protein
MRAEGRLGGGLQLVQWVPVCLVCGRCKADESGRRHCCSALWSPAPSGIAAARCWPACGRALRQAAAVVDEQQGAASQTTMRQHRTRAGLPLQQLLLCVCDTASCRSGARPALRHLHKATVLRAAVAAAWVPRSAGCGNGLLKRFCQAADLTSTSPPDAA